MKRPFLILVLIVAIVAGLGFYMGWFNLSSASDGSDAHVTVSVDKSQIQADKDKVVDKAQDLKERVTDSNEMPTPKPQE